MTRVLAGLQLLKHPPPGQFKILAVTLAGGCFRSQFDAAYRGRLSGFRLLGLDRFAFPSPCHETIIVCQERRP